MLQRRPSHRQVKIYRTAEPTFRIKINDFTAFQTFYFCLQQQRLRTRLWQFMLRFNFRYFIRSDGFIKKKHNIHQQKQRQKIRKWLKQTIFAENYIISSKLAVVTSKWVFIFVLFALVDFFSDQLQLCPEGLRILKLMW